MNTATDTWSVRSAGKTVDGLDENTVLKNFATTFGVSEEKAKSYLQQGKLIKKSLTETNALGYQKNLTQIGLQVIVANDAANDALVAAQSSTPPANHPSTNLSGSSTSTPGALSIAPLGSENDSSSSPAKFSCPKCMLTQDKSDQCLGCGVFFEKLQESTQVDTKRLARSSVTSARASADVDDESAASLISLGSAAVAALVCAFLWKFIAVQFGMELGVVAWAIGGAVGATAVMAGGRGTFVGATCAVLVVLSIFGGKYLYVSEFLNEAVGYMEESAGEDWIDDVYSEVASDREAFALISKDEQSIKRFMVEHDYTDATTSARVPADEYEIFVDEVQPWLEQASDEDDYFAEDGSAPVEFAAALGEVSVWSLVGETLGFMDLIFLFLAVSTAFRLGQSGFAR